MWVQYQYREGSLNGAVADVRSSLLQESQNAIAGASIDLRLSSVRQNDGQIPINAAQYSFCSELFGGSRTEVFSLGGIEELSASCNSLYVKGSSDEWVQFSRSYPPGSNYLACPSHQVVDIDQIPSVRTELGENVLKLGPLPESK